MSRSVYLLSFISALFITIKKKVDFFVYLMDKAVRMRLVK